MDAQRSAHTSPSASPHRNKAALGRADLIALLRDQLQAEHDLMSQRQALAGSISKLEASVAKLKADLDHKDAQLAALTERLDQRDRAISGIYGQVRALAFERKARLRKAALHQLEASVAQAVAQ